MDLTKVAIPAIILSAGFVHAKVVGHKDEMTKNVNPTGTCYKDNNHSLIDCAQFK